MFFAYNKTTNKVVAYSDRLNKYSDKFEQIEIEPTNDELELLKNVYKYDIFIRDKKLVFEKNEKGVYEDNQNKVKEQIEKIRKGDCKDIGLLLETLIK